MSDLLKLLSCKLWRKFWQHLWNFISYTSAGSVQMYVTLKCVSPCMCMWMSTHAFELYCTLSNKEIFVKYPCLSFTHSGGPPSPRWHWVEPLSWVCGVWSGCLPANTPSIADMKGCQKCDGWVASWGLVTAATSGVRGEIGSGKVKNRGPLWPNKHPDWIHLVNRR